jgi:hypothetical protein
MRSVALLAVMVVASVGMGTSFAASPPSGATAVCRDGTYSFSQHHSGTCSHHGGVSKWLDGSGSRPFCSTANSGPGVSAALGRTVVLGRRTRSSQCVRRALPDRRCSPGADYSGLTRSVICSPGFRTSTVRNVPTSEKHAVENEYGMVARPYGRTIEIDHIVSLELGGSNSIANLFPEPGTGAVSYHVKDKLENRLHAMVCAGQITLAGARIGIARDWETLYRRVFASAP